MRIKNISLFLFVSIVILEITSCNNSKAILAYNDIQKGIGVENIKQIGIYDFFILWHANKDMSKIDLNLKLIYQDSVFTYFVKPILGFNNLKYKYYKIDSDSLSNQFPNFTSYNSQKLYYFLFQNLILKKEYNQWLSMIEVKKHQIKASCPRKKNNHSLNYELKNKKVFLTWTWNTNCDELQYLNQKKYTIYFDLITNEHKELTH